MAGNITAGNITADLVNALSIKENGVGMFGGVTQIPVDVTASRDFGVTYTNSTDRTIWIMVSATVSSVGAFINISSEGVLIGRSTGAYTAGALVAAVSPIRAGKTYSFTLSAGTVNTKLISEIK